MKQLQINRLRNNKVRQNYRVELYTMMSGIVGIIFVANLGILVGTTANNNGNGGGTNNWLEFNNLITY